MARLQENPTYFSLPSSTTEVLSEIKVCMSDQLSDWLPKALIKNNTAINWPRKVFVDKFYPEEAKTMIKGCKKDSVESHQVLSDLNRTTF